MILSCSARLSDAALHASFLKAVLDNAVAYRDALHAVLILANSALTVVASANPEIEGLPCPRGLANAPTSHDQDCAKRPAEIPSREHRKGKRHALASLHNSTRTVSNGYIISYLYTASNPARPLAAPPHTAPSHAPNCTPPSPRIAHSPGGGVKPPKTLGKVGFLWLTV
jgi:hypothetical protein